MRNPLTYYGGIGWVLVGVTLFAGVLAVESLAARVVLALLGLGCVILGIDAVRDADETPT